MGRGIKEFIGWEKLLLVGLRGSLVCRWNGIDGNVDLYKEMKSNRNGKTRVNRKGILFL